MLTALIPPILSACGKAGIHQQSFEQSATDATIEPGDMIGSMVVTIGAEDAPPLWAFCSQSVEGTGSYMLDCRAPALASLGIGNIFLYVDRPMDWSDLVWELSIDGQQVDLKSFGTFDYVVPIMIKKPSPVRESFGRVTAWNIVLKALEPGHHTLWFVAQSKMATHTWFVSLDIEAVDETNISWRPFPLPSYVESIK